MRNHSGSVKRRDTRASHSPQRRIPELWVYAALLVTTAAVFAQVRNFQFITLDDLSSQWVLGPLTRQGLTLQGLWWALTSGAENWWFPVTRFSHMLDCQLFGVNSGAAHLMSAFIHILSTSILFAFFRRATGSLWPSAFVAFVFALHPLHVESVAWVAERKDVLCAFFWMLTLWAWLRYSRQPDRRRYAAVAIFLGLALMSKSMAVTLPLVLILVDVWPLRRPIPLAASVKEKLPLFALAAAAGIVTIACARSGGAGIETFPLHLRVENALIRYVLYIEKMFWPTDLALFYPYPKSIPLWQPVAAAILLAAVTAAVIALRRPYLLAGWLWYLGTMAPVIGIVQSGWQAWADRYMYLPMIGLSVMLAWGAAELSMRWRQSARPLAALAVAACAAMAMVTYHQLQYWTNTETLFQHALAVTDRNVIAHNSLGAYYLDSPGRLPEAIQQFQAALRIEPNNAIAHNDLGMALLRTPGRTEEARAQLETAVRIKPDYFEAHNNLAAVLLQTPGRLPDAVAELQAALQIQPDSAEAHYNLGVALSNIPGRLPEAVEQLQAALRVSPDFETAYALAAALAQIPGRQLDAVSYLQFALRLRPGSPQAMQLFRRLTGRASSNN